jgi:hypothetical protein
MDNAAQARVIAIRLSYTPVSRYRFTIPPPLSPSVVQGEVQTPRQPHGLSIDFR